MTKYKATPTITLFRKKYEVDLVTGCWDWTDYIRPNGYGSIWHSIAGGGAPRREYAHRFSYTYFKGPIWDGLQVDHLCRNRACVNPDHLEAVTCQENLLRGEGVTAENAAKTHCPQGHPYSQENTAYYTAGRRCRACRVARNKKQSDRRKEQCV